ncbi:MAG: hypothetical protein GF418_09870, partial [Chitinivibrionales bacterium]|nr:hypothetical protein [Chitinivibrionales bacterium]
MKANPLPQAASVCALLWLLSAGAAAEQFLLVDTTYVHSLRPQSECPYNGWESHWDMAYTDQVPTDWTSPVNYKDGKVYWRLEVQEKPNETVTTSMHLCLNGPGIHCCSDLIHFDTPGVYWLEQAFPWWDAGAPHWNDWVGYPQVVIKDEANNPIATSIIHSTWAYYPDFSQYYPLKLRIIFHVVSAGASFDKPSWWDSEMFNADNATSSERIAATAATEGQ